MKHAFETVLTNVNKLPDLAKKTVIITGATSGIGFALAKIVIMRHGKLVMAVRNIKKALKCKEDLLKLAKNAVIEIEYFDQSNFESINSFLTVIKFKYSDFDSLVLNAGVFDCEKGELTANKYPICSGTNLFGPVYLAVELEKLINGNKEHKIIFQGSLASRVGKYTNFDKDFLDPFAGKFHQYNLSKVGLYNMFCHLSKNANPNFIYCWSEPGICATDIVRNLPKGVNFFVQPLIKLFFQSSLQGALSAGYLICNGVYNGDSVVPSGLFTMSGLPKKVGMNEKAIYYSLPYRILSKIYDK